MVHTLQLESLGQVHRTGTCSQKSNNNGSYTSAPSADTAVYVCVSTKTTIIIITITWATIYYGMYSYGATTPHADADTNANADADSRPCIT